MMIIFASLPRLRGSSVFSDRGRSCQYDCSPLAGVLRTAENLRNSSISVSRWARKSGEGGKKMKTLDQIMAEMPADERNEVDVRLSRLEDRIEKLEETIKTGFQLLHEDIFNGRVEARVAANRLSVVEAVREIDDDVRSINGKLDLILRHLGLNKQ